MNNAPDIWAALPIPALTLDPDDLIIDLNPAAEVFLNASARSLRGEPVWDRLMVDIALDAALSRVRRDAAPLFVSNVDVSTGSTKPLPSNIQIAPFGSRGDALILIEPRQLSDRLGRANAAKSGAKSAIGMSEMLAHEIKNPLAGITGAAQLLAMNLDPKDRELTDLIVLETKRIVELLEQVAHFGNLRPPERRVVNIHDLLERARKSAIVGFAAHMDVSEDYDPSLPSTFVDSDQFLQVFQNLLKNASEAALPDGGTIRIRTFYDHGLRLRRRDGTGNPLPLQVEIIDDGPGLPPNLASEVFDPFVSGRENGTGLGLPLVSKIITEHDGWIEVDSVPGHTVFRVSLPVAPKDEVL